MSRKRDSGTSSGPGNRSGFPVLGAAFAIAMAFFLVIGMIAIAVPEFMGGGNDTSPPPPVVEDDGESEEDRLRAQLDDDPEDVDTLIQLADLLGNTGRYDEAIRLYERAVEQRPNDATLRVAFARILERRGYDLDAEVQLNRALEHDSENVEAMFMLAQIMERDQPPREEEARELYSEIIEVAPETFYAQMAEERLAETGEDAPDDEEEED
jgi:cytochrome c-type biogenesis protein CcmH/NrfG